MCFQMYKAITFSFSPVLPLIVWIYFNLFSLKQNTFFVWCIFSILHYLVYLKKNVSQAKDPEFLDDLEQNIKPDLCITAAYGQYLPKRFLATPTYGTVNIHPSLLPRWRGASPVQRSLEANDNPIGVSVLFTVSKMDAGPVISQKEYNVGEEEQATTVLAHLFDVGTDMLLEAIPDVLNGKMTMETVGRRVRCSNPISL